MLEGLIFLVLFLFGVSWATVVIGLAGGFHYWPSWPTFACTGGRSISNKPLKCRSDGKEAIRGATPGITESH